MIRPFQQPPPRPVGSDLTRQDVDRLMLTGPLPGRALCALLYCLALRHSEAAELQWRDVDYDGARVWIRAIKNGPTGWVALPPGLAHLLAQYHGHEIARTRGRLSPYVFPSHHDAGDVAGDRFSILHMLKAHAAAVNVELPTWRLTPLRHAAAQSLIDGGAPVSQVAAALRHKRNSSTDKYCRPMQTTHAGDSLADRLRAMLDQD